MQREWGIHIGVAHSIPKMLRNSGVFIGNCPAARIERLVHKDRDLHSRIRQEISHGVGGLHGIHGIAFVIDAIDQHLVAEGADDGFYDVWNLQATNRSPGAEEGQEDGFA